MDRIETTKPLMRYVGGGWTLTVWEAAKKGEFSFMIQEGFELQDGPQEPHSLILGEVHLNLPQAEALYQILGTAIRIARDE